MRVKVEVETRTFVRFVLVTAGTALILLLLWKLRGPLTLILVSAFFALALNPPVSRVASVLPGNSRIGATALAYLFIVGLLGGFLVLVIPPAVEQSADLSRQVPSYIDEVRDKDSTLHSFFHRYGLENQLDQAINDAKDQFTVFATNLGGVVVTSASAVLGGVISIITVLVLTFLMLIEGPRWMRRIWSLYGDNERQESHRELAQHMYKVVTSYVNGQLLVALIAAVCTLVVLLILSTIFENVPASAGLPLAAVAFFASMIPLIGATIGATLITVVLLFNDVTAAIVFLVYFIIYQQIENNVVQPTVQSRSVELSALSVLLAILIGINLGGILGALLAIPVAGCIRVLIKYAIERRSHKRKETDGKLVTKVKKAIKKKD